MEVVDSQRSTVDSFKRIIHFYGLGTVDYWLIFTVIFLTFYMFLGSLYMKYKIKIDKIEHKEVFSLNVWGEK